MQTPATRGKKPAKDELFMLEAVKEAKKALKKGEVPIGAVLVKDGSIISRGHNWKETKGDPTAHAEIIAIRRGGKKLKEWRLTGSTLYVTLEPCVMCMGAVIQARIARVVFGARDEKAGACGSIYDLSDDARLNHRVKVECGVLKNDCVKLLSDFFLSLREKEEKSALREKIC